MTTWRERVAGSISKSSLEQLLEQTLVPVEPSARFYRRMKARLVTLSGGGMGSPWIIVVAATMVFLLVVSSLGVALRLGLAVLSLLGLLRRERRQAKQESNSAAA